MIKQTLFLESFKTTYPYVLLFILSFFQCFVFLNYDEPILTTLLYVIITFSFYLFLAQWNQLFLKVFLIFTLLVCFIIYPTFLIYGEPDFNYVASIYYTNSDESFSYIKVIPWMVYLYLFLLLIYTVFLLKLNRISPTKFKNVILYVGQISMILFIVNGPLRFFEFFRVEDPMNRALRIFLFIPLLFGLSHLLFMVYSFLTKKLKI